jgi:hypothetical protein
MFAMSVLLSGFSVTCAGMAAQMSRSVRFALRLIVPPRRIFGLQFNCKTEDGETGYARS